MRISMIAAMSENRVIGRDGRLPWRLPDEMKWFVRATTGHCVIMGRRDFESHNTPLPRRRNIVLTRQRDYRADGVDVVHNLEDALAIARATGEQEAFIIGGGEIYALALPVADRIYLTTVLAHVEGDVCFPVFDESNWSVRELDHHPADDRHFAAWTVRQYDRRVT